MDSQEDVFDEGYRGEIEKVFLNRDLPYEIIKYVPFYYDDKFFRLAYTRFQELFLLSSVQPVWR